MYRFLFFIILLILPATFSWWLFIPISLLFVFLAKFPPEIIIAAIILDVIYYFGDSFIKQHLLTLFSMLLLIAAFLLNKVIHWRKVI